MGKEPLRDKLKSRMGNDYQSFVNTVNKDFSANNADINAEMDSFSNEAKAGNESFADNVQDRYDETKQQIIDDHAAYQQKLDTAYDEFVDHAHGNTVEVQSIDTVNTGGTKDFDPYLFGQAEAMGLTGDLKMPQNDGSSSIVCGDNGVAVLLPDSVKMSGVVDEKGNLSFYAMMPDGQVLKMNDPHIEEAVISANKEYGNPDSAFSKALAQRDQQKAMMNQMIGNKMSR